MTVAELNGCNRQQFVDAVGWIFEHSPWVAERAWTQRPFSSREALHRAMVDAVASADRAEQQALLCAHPDLGTRARVSDASKGEQAGAGLDRLTADEFRRLQELTGRYRQTFGFPFLLAVKGRTSHDVFSELERRLGHGRDAEWQEALDQVSRIAASRLRETVE